MQSLTALGSSLVFLLVASLLVAALLLVVALLLVASVLVTTHLACIEVAYGQLPSSCAHQ